MLQLTKFLEEKYVHVVFETTLVVKGVYAFVEMMGGITLYFVTKNSLTQFVLFLTQGERIEDPKDFLANFFLKSAEQLSINSQHFAALYLLSHGLIKIFLIVGLLQKKLWAYPVSITVFGAFIIYQMYRFTVTGSLWLIIFTIFDLVVVILTIHEYKYMKSSAIKEGKTQ